MPLSTIEGTGGSYTPPTAGPNMKAADWSGDINITVVEDTGFSDGGYESHKPTKVGFKGAATGVGQYGASNTQPIPPSLIAAATVDLTQVVGAITLQAKDGCTLAFTAVYDKIGFNRKHDDSLKLNHSFMSSGQITMVWALS